MKNGCQYKEVRTIDPEWSDYDKLVGGCHLENYGRIFVDEYGCPIDNEYDLEEIETELGL